MIVRVAAIAAVVVAVVAVGIIVLSSGSTYKSDFSAGGQSSGSFALPSWDCDNTGAGGNGSRPTSSGVAGLTQTGTPACWVAPSQASALLGQSGNKFPHVTAAHFSSK